MSKGHKLRKCENKDCHACTSSSTSSSSTCTSSTSSSSSSAATCSPKCERSETPVCPLPCEKLCDGLTAHEISERYKDAVVKVDGQFALVGASGPTGGLSGGVPLSPNGRVDVILSGNGFLIKGPYIVAPAHLVLLPPSLNAATELYPFTPYQGVSGASGPFGNYRDIMVRASRILVTIYNVNGSGQTYVYEASLVGVDGAGDIALLRIDVNEDLNNFNSCNPCIKDCHPKLKFGKSRASRCGQQVFVLGTTIVNGLTSGLGIRSISEGVISNYRGLEPRGLVLAETITITAPVFEQTTGLPILNNRGRVIGMQTYNALNLSFSPDTIPAGYGIIGGITEEFMLPVICNLLNGAYGSKHGCHVEYILDNAGPYYRLRKGYLGLAYEAASASDLDSSQGFLGPVIQFNSTGGFGPGPACKQLRGIRITGLAGADPDARGAGGVYVPGGTGTVAPYLINLPSSPLLGTVLPGDIVIEINGEEVGGVDCEFAPSLITWKVLPGKTVSINYSKQGVSGGTGNYDNRFAAFVEVLDYPKFLDYPWYALNHFPLIGLIPYPGFDLLGQSIVPQVPIRDGNNIPFRSAI